LQDFWNVSAEDPLVHFARFFYGELLRAVGAMVEPATCLVCSLDLG
jgi:hypothetical protein